MAFRSGKLLKPGWRWRYDLGSAPDVFQKLHADVTSLAAEVFAMAGPSKDLDLIESNLFGLDTKAALADFYAPGLRLGKINPQVDFVKDVPEAVEWDVVTFGDNWGVLPGPETDVVITDDINGVSVSACIMWEAVANGDRWIFIEKNGTSVAEARVRATGGVVDPVAVSIAALDVTAGDVLTVSTMHTRLGTHDVIVHPANHFCVSRLG